MTGSSVGGVEVVFCHGLEGSPQGRKVQALRAAGITVCAPDFQGQVLAERITHLDSVLRQLDPQSRPILAGSSYGGAVAAWTAMQHPDRFAGLLLLAPALHYAEPPIPAADAYRPVAIPTIVIHGVHDAVVPISASEVYAAQAPTHIDLRRVDDGHRLAESLDAIVAAVRELTA